MDPIDPLVKLRAIADYQFGRGVGRLLFPENTKIQSSRKTRKLRYVYLNNKLLATVRAKDGLIALTIEGARALLRCVNKPRFRVIVKDEVENMIAEGRDLFAKHIVFADSEIRPMEEVIIVNRKDELLAVGKALLSGEEMTSFKYGKAVRIRAGVKR
jgi:predicted RNA-binding protein (TIGR00451 family)